MLVAGLVTGIALAIIVRAAIPRLALIKLRRDIAQLNDGDYGPLLASFADDAVLHFHEGEHRWSGDHRGKAEIERFLRDFTAAGLQGEISGLWMAGPPWALKLVVRFDDEARDPNGELIYSNRVVVIAHTRWGRIVEQEDFYVDTGRINELERRLQELGVPAAEADTARR